MSVRWKDYLVVDTQDSITNNLTPEMLASFVANAFSEEQANILNAIGKEMLGWGDYSAGIQILYILEELEEGSPGRRLLEMFHEYMHDEEDS